MDRNLANAIASIADPEIRRAAERLAENLKRIIPKEAWANTVFAERVFGFIKGFAESRARELGVVPGTALEKLIDLLDFATADFFQGDGKAVRRETASWLKAFEMHAEERLREARTPEELEGVQAYLEREFEIRKRIAEMVNEAIPPESERRPFDWEKLFRKMDEGAGELAEKIEAWRETQEARRKK